MGAETEIRWLRSLPIESFKASRIDAEAGIIYDVVMVETGEAKGHGFHMEEEFIDDIVAYDLKHFSKRGVPARFGHPGASDNTMGMQMGHFENVRKRKGPRGKMQAIADLHLLDAAEDSPTKPGMKSYVLKMAAEAPDFMMSSIVFRGSNYYQRNKKGEKVIIRNSWDADDSMGKVFIEFGDEGQHYFTDLVDQGAATDNLFSAHSNPHLFVSQAQIFFGENPGILEFVKNNPAKLLEFLTKIGVDLPAAEHKSTFKMSGLKDFLFGKKNEAPEGVDADEIQKFKAELETVKGDIANLQAEKSAADAKVASLTTDLNTATEQVKNLTAELNAAKEKITELEAIPGAEETKGKTDNGGVDEDEKLYDQNPITKKAKARLAKA